MDRRFPIVNFEAGKFSAFFGEKIKPLQVQLLVGGACNSNYLVETEGEKFVCRIHHRGNPQLESAIQKMIGDLVPTPEYRWVGDCSYMDIGNLMRHLAPGWGRDLEAGLRDEAFELANDWQFRASLIDLVSHLEFLTSSRSKQFKLSCVGRIRKLIKLNSEVI